MQTFLTSYNLSENAKVLDNKRLFKQLLEGYQILNTIINNGQWENHPAVKQWKSTPQALFWYIHSIWNECKIRGIAENSNLYFRCKDLLLEKDLNEQFLENPKWWNRQDIISSHRGRLKCKGLIDSICAIIKKKNKIKNLDKWLKERFHKTKNQLKYSDIENLKSWLTEEEKSLISNHYDQFNWSESESLEYVWPV